MEINQWIKKQRLAAGRTQGEIAKSLKLSSPQFISNVERGTMLSPKLVYKLCAKNGWSWREAKKVLLHDYENKLARVTAKR